ncbi:hypothetical protein ACFO4O_07445 [Glaciecola siphonariae]|uniref:DUF885 domain-containing protein n=1 Tax=Glaciecola siphonariae TaxID=521012 RepID=A0ABV9LUW3_9ALTE
MKKFIALALTLSALIACSDANVNKPTKVEEPVPQKAQAVRSIDDIATDYVKLVLSVGQFDADVVDAYYGPGSLKPAPVQEGAHFPFQAFNKQAEDLMQAVSEIDVNTLSQEQQARLAMFQKQVRAVHTKINMLGGETYSFDEEAQLLYDALPPNNDLSYFDALLNELDALLPGEGELSERYNAFNSQFIIPKDKIDVVFRAAIEEARQRTSEHITLPENESFVLEYVTDKAWSGYNYYQGNAQSLIQINIDLPIYISRAVDLAAHEGYPGHHVFNVLLEQNLVNKKEWIEFSVYQLFSPQSLIAEGSANYGIDVAFPGESRLAFEKEVLFPLAGLDTSKAELYYKVADIYSKLSYVGNEAARQYLNGEINADAAADILQKYMLNSPERAAQRVRFFDKYRSYVINYNLGRDLVESYVIRQGGTENNTQKRWTIFEELLSNPKTASMISE